MRALPPAWGRIGVIGALGYAAYQLEKKIIEHYEKQQMLATIELMRAADAAANVIYHSTKARVEKEAAEKIHAFDVEKERQRIIAVGTQYDVAPVPDWLKPGAPVHSKVPIAAPAPYVAPGPIAAPFPIVPTPQVTPKETLKQRITKLLTHPLASTLLGGTAAILASRQISAPPSGVPFAEEPPLTDFQFQELPSGTLGGAEPFADQAFDDEILDEQSADQECETVDPARSPGECRQGWFSETPTKLMLKEWSRRPCQ